MVNGMAVWLSNMVDPATALHGRRVYKDRQRRLPR